ncbi:MAG: SAM-dependent methyltransferase [Clostridia bacterium]|nr:SAM-dependent methyltransferase [Clostridia bacterium]
MTDRLNKIFSVLPECDTFADIGCDHGYMAAAMVKSGKCKKAIISDVSAKCLKKAEQLLSSCIEQGIVKSVVSDGFDNVGSCDLALIAGMGGEEICTILSRAKVLPKTLVLQPMKNCDKVRLRAVECGYKVVYDRVFKSAGKFYDLMVLTFGEDFLTEEEIEFGRDNVKNGGADFKEMIAQKIQKMKEYSSFENVKETDRQKMLSLVEKLKKYA